MPVCAVFDNDEIGKTSFERLAKLGEKGQRFVKNKNVPNYRCVFSDALAYGAEDLWPNELVAAYVIEHGDDCIDKQTSVRMEACGTAWPARKRDGSSTTLRASVNEN